MCGIVGRVNASGDKPVVAEVLRAATRAIVHRGPDGEGLYCQGPVGLGHRRLSIVDIAGGSQPMSNAAGDVWVVFNGEIYNHEALRQELKAQGYTFTSHSDTEVLVHGYEAWGPALTRRLRGMFAFALWDARRQRLLVARDRVGIKPLYWTRVEGDLLFASEVKSLLAFEEVPRLLNASVFPEYLALRYVPGTDTLFRGIHRLEPGHQMLFERGQLTTERYWDIPQEPAADARVDEKEEIERLRALFLDTVRMHMMGEVPVGIFLSGGIDSTAVAWAMKQANPSALKSFSVGFDGDSEGELSYAKMAADALGTQHRELRLGAEDFHGALEKLVWHLDEPNADGACIPLMALSRRAREEVTVVLSGEGADEAFGGYDMYKRLLMMERAQQLGGGLLDAGASLALQGVKHVKVRKYLRMLQQPLEQRYFGIGRGFTDEILLDAFGPGALEQLVRRFAPLWEQTRGRPTLHRLLHNDTKVWLPDDLLIKADKMSMSAAIELRVPFLDHVMLENAWRLPPSLKLRGGVGKWILRKAVEGQVPREILERPKKGFPVPIGRWMRTQLHAPLRDTLLATGSASKDLLGHKMLTRLLEEHRSGRVDRTEELYSLWVFEGWYKRFISTAVDARQENTVREAPALFGEKPAPRPERPAPQPAVATVQAQD